MGDPPDQRVPDMDHFCVQVEPWDAESIRQHLQNHDVEFSDVESRYGARGQGPSIYLNDPERNRVELKGTAPE